MGKKKKKKELKPEAIKQNEFTMEIDKLKLLSESMNKFDFEPEDKKDNDTFYKLAIKELFNEKSIETKTEWLNPSEVFVASKLSFIGVHADIPLMDEFIKVLERKRISLNRKGREEIILALQERRQEEIEIRKSQLGMFGNPRL